MGRRKQYRVETERHLYRSPFFQAGKWRVRRRDKVTGKVRALTLQAENSSDARLEVQEIAFQERQKAQEGILVPNQDLSLKEAFSQWLKTLEHHKASTEGAYLSYSRGFQEALGSETLVNEIRIQNLEEVFFDRWKARHGGTKQAHLQVLRRFFDWCESHGYCTHNPAAKVVTPREWRRQIRQTKESKGQALTLDEARRLLEVCREASEKLYLLVMIALRTGLRRGNIMGPEAITWSDLDLEKRELFLPGERMKNGVDFHVPLHDELVQVLTRVWESRKPRPGLSAQLIPQRIHNKYFAAARERAGLGGRGFRIHDLRHTYASWLAEFCPHAVMQRLLGHAATTVTERYARIRDVEVLRTWVAKLEWLEVAGRDVGRSTSSVSV